MQEIVIKTDVLKIISEITFLPTKQTINIQKSEKKKRQKEKNHTIWAHLPFLLGDDAMGEKLLQNLLLTMPC
jgi:hypothetical protein